MGEQKNGIIFGVLFGLTEYTYWLYVTDFERQKL